MNRRTMVAVALTLLSMGVTARAQTPDAGTLLRTVPSPARPAPGDATHEQRLLGPRKAISDVEGFRATIFGYKVRGLTVVPDEEAERVLKPFTGPKKSYQDVLDAAAALRSRLGDAGLFLADVVVPEQNITAGQVELLVLEGRFGDISVEYDPGVRISRPLVESYLRKLRTGALITTGDVERALFLLNDLRGVSALSFFKPGKTVGTADLVVRVRKVRMLEGYVDFDTNGAYATLEKRIGVNVDVNNALRRGELLNFRAFQSFNLKRESGLLYGRAAAVAPLGNTALRGGLSYAHLSYDLLRGPASIVHSGINGEATIVSGFLSYPVVRSRNLNLIGQWQVDRRDLTDRITAAASEDEKTALVNQFMLSGDIRDTFLGGGVNVFSATVVRGRLDIVSPGRASIDAATLRTEGNYAKYMVALSRLQQLNPDWLLYASMQKQYAPKNLDASEKMVLGGPYGVRAYAPTEGIGDTGTLATLELRRRVIWDKVPGNMVLAGFWDYGSVNANHEPSPFSTTGNTRTIQGYGLGVNWEPPGWYVRGSMAWRAPWDAHSLENSSPTRTPRLYFQAVKFF
ncbi:MAG: POTRA domain-containing protein [Burkholderiales bacterium]